MKHMEPPDASTHLVALVGHPVEHSSSPRMHNAAFRHQGLNYLYVAHDVPNDQLKNAVQGLYALGYVGANITIPHKEAVRELLIEETARAAGVGAVNTLIRTPDGWRGDNTDVAGFLQPLERSGHDITGASAVIFGAGGAARAVIFGLLTRSEVKRCTVAVRSPERAEPLVRDLADHDPHDGLQIVPLNTAGPLIRQARLVVNATPLGMHPHDEGTPWDTLVDFNPHQIVYDLVYNPKETRLLREAAAQGATCIGGLEMLIGQAAEAYRQWTDHQMPIDVVRTALQRQAP